MIFCWAVDGYLACRWILDFMQYECSVLLTKSDLDQQNNHHEYFISCNSLPLQRSMSSSPNVHKHWDSMKVFHIKKGSHILYVSSLGLSLLILGVPTTKRIKSNCALQWQGQLFPNLSAICNYPVLWLFYFLLEMHVSKCRKGICDTRVFFDLIPGIQS